VGGANADDAEVQPLSEALLNGSIVGHLSPLTTAAAPSSGKIIPSDTLPPYGGVKVHTVLVSSAAGLPAGPASLSSGASHGGVLLKHIPYLPAGSVEVGPGAGLEDAGTVPDSLEGSETSGVGGTGSEVMMPADGEVSMEMSYELEQKVRVSYELCI
jgi:PAB1-binding protein PBP1